MNTDGIPNNKMNLLDAKPGVNLAQKKCECESEYWGKRTRVIA